LGGDVDAVKEKAVANAGKVKVMSEQTSGFPSGKG